MPRAESSAWSTWAVIPLLLLVIAHAGAGATQDAPALERLFARAQQDPGAVVALVLQGSRAIRNLDAEHGIQLAQRLQPYCQRLYFSPERLPHEELAGVRLVPRDRQGFWHASRRYHLGEALLSQLNPGAPRRWKVIDGRSTAVVVVVSRGAQRLLLWRRGVLMGIYPISSGDATHPTPLGTTRISSRVVDPQWRDPDSGVIHAPHDAGNFLGGYWMGFDATRDARYRGIGIHGWTAQDESAWVGQAQSHGCLRLRRQDLPQVFACAWVGSRVVIRP